jgi:hypothetical protein
MPKAPKPHKKTAAHTEPKPKPTSAAEPEPVPAAREEHRRMAVYMPVSMIVATKLRAIREGRTVSELVRGAIERDAPATVTLAHRIAASLEAMASQPPVAAADLEAIATERDESRRQH